MTGDCSEYRIHGNMLRTKVGISPQLRKIVIVNTADEGGGAERISMAVLNGFLELGLEAWFG